MKLTFSAVRAISVWLLLIICGLLYARIPHARKIVIEGSGHIVNMEQPELFNRVVLDFLARRSKQ